MRAAQHSFIYEEGVAKEFEIPSLPIVSQEHQGDRVKDFLIHRIVPEPTHMFIKQFAKPSS